MLILLAIICQVVLISLDSWLLANRFFFLFFSFFFKIYFIYYDIVVVFRHTRRGHQIPLQMVVGHLVVAGN